MIAGTGNQDEVITQQVVPLLKRKRTKSLLIITLLVILGFALKPSVTAWQQGARSINQNDILIAEVEYGDLIRDVAVSGKVIAANSPQLYSSEPGQVLFNAKPGQSVEKGALLATITSPELTSEIAQQQAGLEQLKLDSERGALQDKEALLDLEKSLDTANVKLIAAKREKERADLSFEKKVMSQIDYAKIQDLLLEAELFYQHAKKRVELGKERLEFERKNRDYAVKKQQLKLDELNRRESELSITSPVSGIVGNWLVDDKDKVAANKALITVVDLSAFEAELSVPEFYADDLGLGLTVAMKIGDNKINGKIIAISPEIVANQVQVKATISANDIAKLRQNQRLTARIEFEKKSNVLKVKRGPFLGSSGGRFAYQLNSENTATKTPISIGISSVEYVEINGLQQGDRIIISDYSDYNTINNLLIEQP